MPGAQGATVSDQDKIDEHVARACAAKVYTFVECDKHTSASGARRAAIINAEKMRAGT